jgi:hypothetical protein
MRTAPEIKYTERDVRENDELRDLAETYVRNYGGEFDPLVRAFNMLSMDGALTTAMTRTVLNCMRHDINIASQLPEPRGYTLPERPHVLTNVKKKKEPKREPKMLYIGARLGSWQVYSYKCKINFDYVINLHMQAKWYHQIDHSRTVLCFYPQDWPHDYDGTYGKRNAFRLQELRGMCGADLRRAVGVTKFFGTLEDAEESDNEFCPRCKYGHRDASWKP